MGLEFRLQTENSVLQSLAKNIFHLAQHEFQNALLLDDNNSLIRAKNYISYLKTYFPNSYFYIQGNEFFSKYIFSYSQTIN